jgi:hypothetical protein
MRELKVVEDQYDSEGFVTEGGYVFWTCDCGSEVRRYRGQSDVDCNRCGASYNASGQRLRDNWRDNPSNYDDEIGDLEGYEIACLRRELG